MPGRDWMVATVQPDARAWVKRRSIKARCTPRRRNSERTLVPNREDLDGAAAGRLTIDEREIVRAARVLDHKTRSRGAFAKHNGR